MCEPSLLVPGYRNRGWGSTDFLLRVVLELIEEFGVKIVEWCYGLYFLYLYS
jgi:hypothetical protein